MVSFKDLAVSAVRTSGLVTQGGSDVISVSPKEEDPIILKLQNALRDGNAQSWNENLAAWKKAPGQKDNDLPVIKGVLVEGKTLEGFRFDQVALDNCTFDRCILKDDNFTHSRLQNGTGFIESTFDGTSFYKSILDGTSISGEFTNSKIYESALSNVCIDATFHNKGSGNAIYYNEYVSCANITERKEQVAVLKSESTGEALQFNNNKNVHNSEIHLKEGEQLTKVDIETPGLKNQIIPGKDCPCTLSQWDKLTDYPPTMTAKEERRESASELANVSYENLQRIDVITAGGGKNGYTGNLELPFHQRDNARGFSMLQGGLHIDSYMGSLETTRVGAALGYTGTAGKNVNDDPALRYSAQASLNSIQFTADDKVHHVAAPGLNLSATGYRGNFGASVGVDAYAMNSRQHDENHHSTLNAKSMVVPSLTATYKFTGHDDSDIGSVSVFAQIAKPFTATTLTNEETHFVSSQGNDPRIMIGIKATLGHKKSR